MSGDFPNGDSVGAESMEDGFIEPADRGEVRVDVKWVEVTGQAVQSSLQR